MIVQREQGSLAKLARLSFGPAVGERRRRAFSVTASRSRIDSSMWLLRVEPAIKRPDLDNLVAKLSRQLGIRRRVRLLVTASRIGPAVIGLFRPMIVLPEIVVQGKRAEDLEAIIAHELLHVRRGDLWLGLLQVCAKAVWWFHPLVWWASRMSAQEAERCCDEEVIGELRCDRKRYARSLLEVLELKRTLRTIPAFPGMKPVEVTFQRLERIMKLGQGCHKRTPGWCWGVMLLLAAGVLPGAALVLATDPPEPSSAKVDDKSPVVATSVEERLSQPITVRFTNLPLHEALAVISKEIDLPIEIDIEDVAVEGVTPKQPVTLIVEGTSADNALRLLLESHKLRYSLEDDTITVRSETSAPMFPVVYNIADLLKHDLDWLDHGEVAKLPSSSKESIAAATLVAAIVARVNPESWSEAGRRGAIKPFLISQSLVVSQTEGNHRKVRAYLNDIRVRMGMAAKTAQAPPLALRRGKSRNADTNIYVKIYNVADFVIPIPTVVQAPKDLPRYRKQIRDGAIADLNTLIDLITSTIAPDSWEPVGGRGLIEPFPSDLSVVIGQTAEIHDQLADLLKQLRRMQDVQITIAPRFLRVPKSLLSREELPSFGVGDFIELDLQGVKNTRFPLRLSESKAAELLNAAEQNADSQVVPTPRVTVFNGQRVAVSAAQTRQVDSTLQFEVVSSPDRQFVHFKFAADGETKFNERSSERMRSGEALLLPIDESVAKAWMGSEDKSSEIAILRNLPDPSLLFKNKPVAAERVALLLVTPRIVVLEREQELVDPSE